MESRRGGFDVRRSWLGWLPAIPIQITAGVDTGYDDNVTLQPSGEGSIFTKENVVLTYDRPGEQTEFFVLGVGRFTQYFDVTGQNETAGNVTMSLTHNFSTRLSFYASIYGAYQNEPNFQSNVGPENVRDCLSSTRVIFFRLLIIGLPRLTTVTSYTFERVQVLFRRRSEILGTVFRRRSGPIQNTFGEELQFSLTSRTGLVGEYRFEAIDYDTAPLDSTTHFLLAGVNHNLTEHLIVHLRGGESFRSLENDGDTASPYFEGSLGLREQQPFAELDDKLWIRIAHSQRTRRPPRRCEPA